MVLLKRLVGGLRGLLHRARVDEELDAELRTFLETAIERHVRAGLSREQATRAARIELGSVDAVKDGVRDIGWDSLVDDCWHDVRYAARILRRNPLFSVTAAASLAIGISATTTIFTIANGLLLRAAPGVSAPSRLVDISKTQEGAPLSNPLVSYRTYLDLRERLTTLEGLYAFQGGPETFMMGEGAERQRVFATIVTPNYFDLLGVTAASGRLFRTSDTGDASRHSVVLSHAFWRRQFHADRDVVGRTIVLDGSRFLVVGIADEGFWGASVVASDIWLSIDARPMDANFYEGRRGEWGMMGGRLKPGVSAAQAAAELDAVRASLLRDYPNDYQGIGFLLARASPIPAGLRFVLTGFLSLLMALVSVMLLIACANVAGVLLARAAARRHEVAVRVAIGASRGRIMRQLLTETLLLFLIAAGASLWLARGLTTLLLKLLPVFPVPIALSLPLDGLVVAFAMAVALVAAVLSGLAPALHVSRSDLVNGVRDAAHEPSDRLRLRSAFVITQVAFSLLLVVAAGVLSRALVQTATVRRGADLARVEAAAIDLEAAGYSEAAARLFVPELARTLGSMAGVESVTFADQRALAGGSIGPMRVPGVAPPGGREFFAASWQTVDHRYFATLGIPFMAGRDFPAATGDGTVPSAVITDAGARQIWPGEDPIGKFIEWPQASAQGTTAPTVFQVVGVVHETQTPLSVREVREVRANNGAPGPVGPPLPAVTVFVSLQHRFTRQLMLVVRMAPGYRATEALHAAAPSLRATLGPLTAEPVEQKGGSPVELQLRIAASVAGSVGSVGVFLAALGIYGVTAYLVTRRTREIGVRIAMGARPADIGRLVLGQGLWLVFIGAAVGLALSAAGSRLLNRLLFGAPSIDPFVYAVATLLFVAMGLAACYMPARRAMRINPTEALRYE